MKERAIRGLYWTGHHIATAALRASAGLTYIDHVLHEVGRRGEAICDAAGRLMDRLEDRRSPPPSQPLRDCPTCHASEAS